MPNGVPSNTSNIDRSATGTTVASSTNQTRLTALRVSSAHAPILARMGRATLTAAAVSSLLLMAMPTDGYAQSLEWNGTGSGSDWGAPVNWTPYGVPDMNGETAEINDNGAAAPVIELGGATYTVDDVNIAGATDYQIGVGTLDIANALTNTSTGDVELGVDVTGAAAINQAGTGSLTLLGTNMNTGAVAVTAGVLTNAGSIVSSVDNQTDGTFNNTGTAMDVTNAGTAQNDGTIGGTLTNTNGTTTNSGTVTGVTTISGGTVSNSGQVASVDNQMAGTFDNFSAAADVTNAGTAQNDGTISGTLTNTDGTTTNSGTVTGVTTISGGTVSNSGQVASVDNQMAGTFNNTGTAVDVTNAGTLQNDGTISGTLTNTDGTTTNTGTVTGVTTISGGEVNNSGMLANVDNQTDGTFNNQTGGSAQDVTSAGTGTNASGATIASLSVTGGSFANTGTITAGDPTVSNGIYVSAPDGVATASQADGVAATTSGPIGITVITRGADGDVNGTGIEATNSGPAGDISIDLGANVNSNDDGVHAVASGDADITVTMTEGTPTPSIRGADHGILAETERGIIAILLGSDTVIEGSGAEGIELTSSASGGADLSVRGSSGSVIGATDGVLMTTAGSDITVQDLDLVQGNAGDGIAATSNGGAILVDSVDEILGTGGNGVLANSADGNLSIINNGNVNGITGTVGDAIQARSTNGTVLIADNGALMGQSNGVYATGQTVTVRNNEVIDGTTGDGVAATVSTGPLTISGNGAITGQMDGIDAISAGGLIDIDIDPNALVEGTTGVGIRLSGSNQADSDIDLNANVTGAIGIEAETDGVVDILLAGTTTVEGTAAEGIRVTTADASGDSVTIDGPDGTVLGATAGVDVTTQGSDITVQNLNVVRANAGDGIAATSNGGAILVNSVDEILGTGGNGVLASAGTGNITITNNGGTNNIIGTSGDGVLATSTDGTIDISDNSDITGSGSGVNASGDAVTIANNGVISGTGSNGITATVADGTLEIAGNADIIGEVDGINATSTGSGLIDIDIPASGPVTGQTGAGVRITSSGTGDTDITSNGTISGETGLAADIAGGDLDFTNNGALFGTGGDAISATAMGGAFNITNTGEIGTSGAEQGRVEVTGSDPANSLFDNSGSWYANGASFFDGSVNNAGLIDLTQGSASLQIGGDFTNTGTADLRSPGETTTLTVDGDLNNTNIIDLRDGDTNDGVTVGGTYTGGGTLGLDLDLTDAAGGAANGEQITVGDVAGNNTIAFQIAPGTGVLLTDDIPVVINGATGAGSFTTDVPLASSGFVDYALVQSGNDIVLRSTLNTAPLASALGGVPAAIAAANVAFSTPARATISGRTQQVEEGQISYGVWTRLLAGHFDADSSGVAVNANSGTSTPIGSSTDTRFGGLQVGVDLARFDLGSDGKTRVYVGLTAGQFKGDTINDTTDISFEQSFAGIYGRVQTGNLTFDALVRRDLQDIDTLITGNNGAIVDTDIDGDGYSVLLQANYDVELNGYDFKTSADLFYSRVELDDVATQLGNSISIDPIETLVGKTVLNVSRGVVSKDQTFGYRPFVEVGVQHDFGPDITSTITGNNAITGTLDNFGTQFLVGAGVGVAHLANDWVFGMKGEVKIGEDLNGFTGNLVFRKNF